MSLWYGYDINGGSILTIRLIVKNEFNLFKNHSIF